MGSRLKNLFWGNSSTNNALKGGAGSYDSAVALEPPVKGSYPVAGNGPNVLEEIRRSRAKKESTQQSNGGHRQSFISSFAPSASGASQRHEGPNQRPRTAPNGGVSRRDIGSPASIVDEPERTRSGFSMKSPPSFFSNRRKSVVSTHSFVPAEPPPPLPKDNPRLVQAYIPKKGPSYSPTPNLSPTSSSTPAPQEPQTQHTHPSGFVPPFAQHQRNSSLTSHSSHVDLLDAYSSIRSGKETSQRRAKASGVRNYGEDVADRNIADFGEKDPMKLDLNSPDFSYLKSVYIEQKRRGQDADAYSRAGSALGHVLGSSDGSGDDTVPRAYGGQASSIRSFNTTGPRPGMVYPARRDSASNTGYGVNGGYDETQSVVLGRTYDPRGRAMSPLSAAIHEEPPPRDPRRESANYIRSSSVQSRGRTLDPNTTRPLPLSPQGVSSIGQEPSRINSPIQVPPRVTSPIHSRNSSAAGQVKQRQRTMSATSQTNGSTKSRSGSVSYSVFPTITRRESPAQDSSHETVPRSMANSGNRRYGTSGDITKESTGLYGVTDLVRSIDTDVKTRTNSAILQEHVQPTRHEIGTENITRDVYNHDIYHRVLPIVEREVLPPKHFVHASDGKSLVEIPESQISDYLYHADLSHRPQSGDSRHGAPVHYRQESSNVKTVYPQQDTIPEEASADAPVIPLARRDPSREPKHSRSRGDSRSSVKSTTSKSGSRTKNILEPLRGSNKENTASRDANPRSEYVWHHLTTVEGSGGPSKPQPKYVGTGLGDLSGLYSGFDFSDDEDVEGKEFGAMREDFDIDGNRRQNLSFPDLEYDGHGMLPGLNDHVLGSRTLRRDGRHLDGIDGRRRFEEATSAMKRLKERRRNSVGVNGINGV